MPRAPIREIEVLRILARHGSLSTHAINLFLDSRLSPTRLKALLKELCRKKLTRKVLLRLAHSPIPYWLLNIENPKRLEQIKLRAGIQDEDIRFKNSHWSMLPTDTHIALIQASIEKRFPEIEVYRRTSKSFGTLPSNLASIAFDDVYWRVDLVLGAGAQEKWLSIELADYPKKKLRLQPRRLKKHGFGGYLISYYHNTDLEKHSQQLYRNLHSAKKLQPQAPDNFLAISSLPTTTFEVDSIVLVSGVGEIKLADWIAERLRTDTEATGGNKLCN